jgi:hypothetical protein
VDLGYPRWRFQYVRQPYRAREHRLQILLYLHFLLDCLLLLAYFFYPKTRGRTLDQMVFIFDGQDAEVVPAEETAEIVEEEEEQKRMRSGC